MHLNAIVVGSVVWVDLPEAELAFLVKVELQYVACAYEAHAVLFAVAKHYYPVGQRLR